MGTLSPSQYQAARVIVDRAAQRHGHESVARIDHALAIGAGLEPAVAAADPLQQPALLVPGLAARPWHDPAAFDFVPRLEAAADEVRRELDGVLAQRAGFQPYHQSRDDFVPEGFWDAFFFRIGKDWLDENRELCPGTFRLLESIPRLAEIAMFSMLRPGGHITPHCGTWNCRLTVHLGLRVPGNGALRVGSESRGWEEGRCMVFDDSFEHEAWNRSSDVRVVLLLDVWHPDLTDLEVRLLEELRAVAGLHDGTGMVREVRREREALRSAQAAVPTSAA